MAKQLGNQSLNDQLKEHKEKFVADGGLTDVLRAEIKAILQTKLKNILNQTPNPKDEIILLIDIPNDKGAPNTSNPELSKGTKLPACPKITTKMGFLNPLPEKKV